MSIRMRRLTGPGTLALACTLMLAIPVITAPQFDPDYWWHVLVGDRILHGSFPRTDPFTFTAQGHAFVVQEWGSETLFALLMRVGTWAVIALMTAVTAAGLLLALDRARRFSSSNGILAVLALLALAAGRTVFGPRPQMFTFLFVALLLWVLDHHRRTGGRAVWWLIPMFAVWGNLHGGFALGLGLFFVVIAGDCLDALVRPGHAVPWPRIRTMAAVFAAGVVAPVLNPNGPGVLRYAGGLLSNAVAQNNLDEWRSPSFHDPNFIPLTALIALLIVVGPRAARVDLANALLAGAGVVLSLYAVRNLSTVIITSLPVLAAGLDGWFTDVAAWRERRGGRRTGTATGLHVLFCAAVLGVTAALAGILTATSLTDPRNDDRSAAYPVAVADALCRGPKANVLQPYGSAGWLLYELDRGAPQPCARDPVFIFGDVFVMGPGLFQEYLDATSGAPDTAEILNRRHVGAVWQPRASALAAWLHSSPFWQCVWGNAGQVIYARTGRTDAWPSAGSGC